ncbi:hypothetical protein HanIR_Chr01g0045201 [Helianthus annuus]|nr:hypothetical protein HanIR_Chr01g0045201 [Helianthus annuus]
MHDLQPIFLKFPKCFLVFLISEGFVLFCFFFLDIYLAASCVTLKAVWWHVRLWLKIPIFHQRTSLKVMADCIGSLKGSGDWKKTIQVIFHTTLWRI